MMRGLGLVTAIVGCLFWAQVAARDSPEAFVEAFEQAFSEQSLASALTLFYWKRVPPEQQGTIVSMIDRDLSMKLVSTKVLALGAGPTYSGDSSSHEPNVPLVGHLLVEFEDAAGQRRFSMHMIGVLDGVFFIALPVAAEPSSI